MKSKLVLWGENAQNEKILIAVSLRTEENKIDIWTFPESEASEEFYQNMMKDWRDGEGMEFPETHTHIVRDLTMGETLLPEDLKVERTDVVQRAQTEWHFIVLSSKLHQSYKDQMEELRDRVEKLESFDQGVWDSLKEFWAKVQEQVSERNLFKDHADGLKESINGLFTNMKALRQKMDDEFERLSKETRDKFFEALDEIENKMEGGGRLRSLFDELKKMQHKFRDASLTREHRAKVWDKLDAAFKGIKQKQFGNKASEEGNSPHRRLQHRYEGLFGAIERMEQSIERDKNDLEFQQHKIDTTSGQLEAQIRQAKIMMIEERISSKEEKLNEMNATKLELEKRIAIEKERELRRSAREAAKEKIAEDIKVAAEAREEDVEKLQKAAGEIVEAKAPNTDKSGAKKSTRKESAIEAVGDSLEDVVDTVKAVATVISEQIEGALAGVGEEIRDNIEEFPEVLEKDATDNKEIAESPAAQEEPQEESFLETLGTKVADSLEEAVDAVKTTVTSVSEEIEDALGGVGEEIRDNIEEFPGVMENDASESKEDPSADVEEEPSEKIA